MCKRLFPRFTLPLLFSLLLLPLVLGLAGCDSGGGGELKENLKPFVRITGGPPQGLRDSYTARIWWTGWDEDGAIQQYEYTIDPPLVFTEEEINNPEQFADIRIARIRGPEEGTDTLRVLKDVDGTTYEFRWIQTRVFSRSFAFETPVADSVSTGGTRRPGTTFSGQHTVFLRAMDNEDLYSDLDRLTYTAQTLVPSANITKPVIAGSVLRVGSQVRVAWDGLDADSPDPRKKPIGYLYKLVKLNELNPPIGIIPTPQANFVMYEAARGIPWTYQSAETLQTSAFLVAGSSYMFAVRAVDVAGAVEARLDYTRGGEAGNAFVFQSLTTSGRPDLTVREPSLGSVTARGGFTQEWEVPVGKKLNFTWQATAEEYGGVIEGYNWGINIPDLEREGPGSGWRGWSTLTRNLEPIVFTKPGVNTVTVRSRDTGGITTTISLILTVVDFPLDREILVVDDAKDGVYPNDTQRDAFWAEIMINSGRFSGDDLNPDLYRWDSHGPNDTFFLSPDIPSLAEFGRYKLILYDCSGGAGFGGRTGLVEAGPRRRYLGAHLGAGGKLWITGTLTTAAMIPTVTGTGDFDYPHKVEPGMFPYEFLKMYSDRVEATKNEDTAINGMLGVEPFPGRPETFPAMEVDTDKLRLAGYGVGDCDLVFDPIFQQSNPSFKGEIDSLYIFKAIGPTQPRPRSSTYHNRLNAIRWSNPDPNRNQGRTMWFGFPVYFLKNDQFQETFNRAIDWFREETPNLKSE